MEVENYDLSDWESDFFFLSRYVFRSESGYFPPDYEQEIKEHFEKDHPQSAEFRLRRTLAALRFLISNLDSFKVGGLAQEPPDEAVQISDSLWFALWMIFCEPDEENFDPNPDPQKVVEIAEEADADGLFSA